MGVRRKHSRRSTPAKDFRLRVDLLEDRCLLSGTDGISANEQLMIYVLNRARNNPVQFQVEHSDRVTVDLSDITPQPPLAVNAVLTASTGFKAAELADSDYFEHQSAVTGLFPNELARNCGYVLPDFYPNDQNNIESLAAGFPATIINLLEDLIEDRDLDPPGHRIQLLATIDFFQTHREIGVGFANNPGSTFRNYLAIHTAVTNDDDLFLTGVVYDDANSNGRYDLNEGLPGVTISDGTRSVATNAAGGWSLPTSPGARSVTASGAGFVGSDTIPVEVTDSNIEIDFLSGQRGQVNFVGVDPGFLEFATVESAVAENAGSVTITVARRDGASGTVQVAFRTTTSGDAIAGQDFTATSGTLTFADGETSKSFAITILDDAFVEQEETIEVTLSSPTGGAQLGDIQTATIRILDFEPAVIKGRVFDDLNGDGGRSVDEPILPSTLLFLDLNRNGTFETGEPTRLTRTNGRYRFGNLAADNYRVCVAPLSGFVLQCSDVTVAAAETATGVELGTFRPATIRGRIFDDSDRNTLQDGDEFNVSLVTVFLDLAGDGAINGADPVRTSSATGTYRFRNLTPGTYQVRLVVPSGFEPVSPVDAVATMSVQSGRTARVNFAIDEQPLGAAVRSGARAPFDTRDVWWTLDRDL